MNEENWISLIILILFFIGIGIICYKASRIYK